MAAFEDIRAALEPVVSDSTLQLERILAISQAVSLKRSADALERIAVAQERLASTVSDGES